MIDRGDSLPELTPAEHRFLLHQNIGMARHALFLAKKNNPTPFVQTELSRIIDDINQLDHLLEVTP